MQNPFLLYCTAVGSGLLIIVVLLEGFFLGILVVVVPLTSEVRVTSVGISLETVVLDAVELDEVLLAVILTHDLQFLGTIY